MKTLKIFLLQLQEKRSHASLNTEKHSVIDFVQALKDSKKDTQTFLTMVHIPKLGINPINLYETPTGIYSYLLSEYTSLILKQKNLFSLPYQSEAPYVLFFQIKDAAAYRVIDIAHYSMTEFEQDAQRLKLFYEKEIEKLISVNSLELSQAVKKKQEYLHQLGKSIYTQYLQFVSTASLGSHRSITGKLKDWNTLVAEVEDLVDALDKEKSSESYDVQQLIEKIKSELLDTIRNSQNKGFAASTFSLSSELEDALKKTHNSMLIRLLQKVRIIAEKIKTLLKQTNANFSIQTTLELREVIKNIRELITKLKTLPENEQNLAEIKNYEKILRELNVLYLKVSDSSIPFNIEAIAKHNAERLYSLSNRLHRKYRSTEEDVKSFAALIKETVRNAKDAGERYDHDDAGNRFCQIWYLSGKISAELAKRKFSRNVNIWNFLMLKVLNIGGVIDRGYSIIHENEPNQCVFFTNKMLKSIKITHNKNYRKEKAPLTLNEKTVLLVFGAHNSNTPLKDVLTYIQNYNGELESISIQALFSKVDYLKQILDIILKDEHTRKKIKQGKLWINDLLKQNYKISKQFMSRYGSWWKQTIAELETEI